MTTAASIAASLTLNNADYNAKMDAAMQKADALKSKFQNVGGQMQKAGGILTAGLTAPLLGLGAASVKSASDLEESQNAVNVVFGESANILDNFGATSATSVGLARSEFNQLGAVTGAFLKNLGYDTEGAADQTIALTQRASDMASIFNTDVSQALEAIQSGLKGEFNPLEQFAVKMNAASISAKALEMGLAGTTTSSLEYAQANQKVQDSTGDLLNELGTLNASGYEDLIGASTAVGDALELVWQAEQNAGIGSDEFNAALENLTQTQIEHSNELEGANKPLLDLIKSYTSVDKALQGTTNELTDNMKAQAALALIFEQTEQFAGDFQNTSDGLANGMKILKADLADVGATLGQQLLPYVIQAMQWFSGLVNQFKALTPEQQKMILVILGIVAAIGPLLIFIGSLVSAIGALIPVITAVAGVLSFPLIAIILAVAAVIGLLVAAWRNNWGGIQEKTQAVVAALKALWENVLLPAIMKVWGWMKTVLFPFFIALGQFLLAVFGKALEFLAALWSNVLWPAMQKVIGWIKENVMPVLEPVAVFLKDKLAKAFTWVSDAIRGVTDWLSKMADRISNLSLPDWLTPGSPTPFETGLWGIRDALRAVDGEKVPLLQSDMLINPLDGAFSADTSENKKPPMVVNLEVKVDGVLQDPEEAGRKLVPALRYAFKQMGVS